MRFPFRKNRPFLLNKQQQQQQQHQLNDNDSVSSSRDESSPPPPRIQSSQPDLIIRVGEEGTTYNYFKVLMAHHSKHIDELLLNDPSLTELSFPDIQPGVWELMVSCLRPSNTITVTSAYLVFPFYTKYQFEEGLRICDQRIRAEMERTDDLPLQHDDNNNKICSRDDREAFTKFLDARIRYLIDFADLLPQTREAGIAVLEAVLHDQLSRLFLTQQQFKSLLPLLLKEERLLEPVRLVLADVGITVPDIILAEEHDAVNTIYQLLKLQFKLDYARSQGCDFPDEEQQQQPDEAYSVMMTMVDDSDNFSTQHQSPPSAVILEDETKSGSYRMFKTPRPRLGSQTPSQRTFCIDDSDHS